MGVHLLLLKSRFDLTLFFRRAMKSEHGLSARSGATKMQISREHYELQCKYFYGDMSFTEYRRRLAELKRKGLVRR